MKYLIIILLLSASLTLPAQKKLNCDSARTQGELNACAARGYKDADNELNKLYSSIVDSYKSDTVFIRNLKTAEKLWIKLRDAELMVKFPEGPGYSYGSVQPMCVSMYLMDLTNERIKYLKQWINGAEEGEACRGSVKWK
jgi:uncharacterized protein YecT (DUF1311 family)